ncbi:MAG: sigma-E factor negative regulatory protein [Gallionellaceae bacterium]|jgi:sigma-E factor negative regulatory protein RseA
MNQNISTLMDGEMSDEEAIVLLGRIKSDVQAQQEWRTFHLIGDVLRQPDHITPYFGDKFAERLRAEPTILAPQSRRDSKASYFAMSAVASIMAMAFLAWVSVQVDGGQLDRQSQQLALKMPDSLPLNNALSGEGMDDYLLAHHEYSPSTDVRGASSYIHTVSLVNTAAGR